MIPFDSVVQGVAGVPWMTPDQGRIIYDHVRQAGVRDALELGTGHGTGAAYIAAALPPGGRLTTVDHREAAFDPSPEDVLGRAGVADRVDVVREYASYTWWLKEQVERHSRDAAGCVPQYDFVYLDGAKNFTIDGLAVVLIEKLLRPGGWLLMDDLGWTYADDPSRESSDGVEVRGLSDAERTEPHLRAVFDLVVGQHPAFTTLRIQDDWWGWAQKGSSDAPRRLELVESRPVSVLAMRALRRARREARRRWRSRSAAGR